MKASLPLSYCLLGLTFFSLANEACAKSETSSERDRGRVLSAEFGDCLVKQTPGVARAIVLSEATTKEMVAADNGFFSSCLGKVAGMGSRLKWSSRVFHHMLAGALVRRDYASPKHFDFAGAPPLVRRASVPVDTALKGDKAKKAEKNYIEGQAHIWLLRYGECVVRRYPNEVHALLLTKVTSADEAASFASLSKAFSECLNHGAKLNFGYDMLRGALAVDFYRLAGAPVGVQVVTLEVKS